MGAYVWQCIYSQYGSTPWFFFFFSSRRRHTRLQGDWSSDVCSSDLAPTGRQRGPVSCGRVGPPTTPSRCRIAAWQHPEGEHFTTDLVYQTPPHRERSDRKSVV